MRPLIFCPKLTHGPGVGFGFLGMQTRQRRSARPYKIPPHSMGFAPTGGPPAPKTTREDDAHFGPETATARGNDGDTMDALACYQFGAFLVSRCEFLSIDADLRLPVYIQARWLRVLDVRYRGYKRTASSDEKI